MVDKQKVELVCDACGKRGPVEMHAKLAEAVHSHDVQDKITEIFCSACSVEKEKLGSWTISLGKE